MTALDLPLLVSYRPQLGSPARVTVTPLVTGAAVLTSVSGRVLLLGPYHRWWSRTSTEPAGRVP